MVPGVSKSGKDKQWSPEILQNLQVYWKKGYDICVVGQKSDTET